VEMEIVVENNMYFSFNKKKLEFIYDLERS
jgi:hypothetical protein